MRWKSQKWDQNGDDEGKNDSWHIFCNTIDIMNKLGDIMHKNISWLAASALWLINPVFSGCDSSNGEEFDFGEDSEDCIDTKMVSSVAKLNWPCMPNSRPIMRL